MNPNRSLRSIGAAILFVGTYLALHSNAGAAPPRLLPFQGRLTDATGTPCPDGAKVVQFKIYDAPTGGNALWPGEVQKLTVNGGLVSTLLGSKAALDGVDFNQALYLEITVDANADSQVTAADPPLLPRQSILPAVFAVEAQSARTLKAADGQSYDWSAVFGNQSPTIGKINASRLADGSITKAQLATGTVTGDRLADDTVTSDQLAASSVGSSELAANSITNDKVATAAIDSVKIADGCVALNDLAVDVQNRFVALENRVSALEAGQWSPVTDSLGELPFAVTSETAFNLPASIPAAAKQILVYVRAYSGNVSPAESASVQIYTKQNAIKFAHSFYAYTYPQDAIAFNSSTFWLPVTSDRKLYAQSDNALSTDNSFRSAVYVIGYK